MLYDSSLRGFLASMKGKRILREGSDCVTFEILSFQSTAFNDSFSGIPGLEHNPKRYVLSISSTVKSVKRADISILRFLQSRAFKRKYSKAFESYTFYVIDSNKPIKGIPGWIAVEY